jgi:hypothetical protein
VVAKLMATESLTGTADGGVVVSVFGRPAVLDVKANGGAVVLQR